MSFAAYFCSNTQKHAVRRAPPQQHTRLIKVVTGLRRSGKSTLLLNLFPRHLRQCGVDDSHIIKVDLEDRRNRSLRDPDALIAHIDGRMQDEGMYYILLDEIQMVREFEDVLNSYLKTSNADVYVTGSNSRFLSKDVITEFRGRGFEIRVSPLSFKEFAETFDGSRENAMAEYLTFGGLPGLLECRTSSQKAEYLTDLYKTTYLTDIKERYHIKQDSDMEELMDVLASSIGGMSNPTKLANTFKSLKGSSVSAHTIQSHISILEDVFLIEKAMRYDIKGRRYIDTPYKCYFTDLGLRNARIGFRQNEPTHLMENLVYNEMRLRGWNVDVGQLAQHTRNDEGKSVRKQLEVDFVCNQGDKRIYIQSALRLPTEEKRQQELRSLLLIGDSFPKYIITEDPLLRHHNNDGVIFMNIYDFLLHKDEA